MDALWLQPRRMKTKCFKTCVLARVLLVLSGAALGLTAALALTQMMASLIFNVRATDPTTFASISLLLVGIAFLAVYLPARGRQN
jgi:hypothetical protein